eukprot:GHRR01024084.1.p1 GENE.GHRR01024084.1~~GHRR01024084.1.p1  ORF type:complete len:107 (-),score=4.05 GHRR01024084.1:765-1085(-)
MQQNPPCNFMPSMQKDVNVCPHESLSLLFCPAACCIVIVRLQNRHLLRWWVHTDNNKRPIAPHFAPRSNVGPQGGFSMPHYRDLTKQRLPLYPYSRHNGLGQSHVK